MATTAAANAAAAAAAAANAAANPVDNIVAEARQAVADTHQAVDAANTALVEMQARTSTALADVQTTIACAKAAEKALQQQGVTSHVALPNGHSPAMMAIKNNLRVDENFNRVNAENALSINSVQKDCTTAAAMHTAAKQSLRLVLQMQIQLNQQQHTLQLRIDELMRQNASQQRMAAAATVESARVSQQRLDELLRQHADQQLVATADAAALEHQSQIDVLQAQIDALGQ